MGKIKTEVVVLVLLWLSILLSLVFKAVVDIGFLIAIIGLTISTIMIKKYSLVSLMLLLLLLFLSVFNIVTFSLFFGVSFMGINVIELLLLVVLAFGKRDVLIDVKNEWFDKDERQMVEEVNSEIEFFKDKFQGLSTDNLKNKLNEEDLVLSARKAILDILNERK